MSEAIEGGDGREAAGLGARRSAALVLNRSTSVSLSPGQSDPPAPRSCDPVRTRHPWHGRSCRRLAGLAHAPPNARSAG